MRLEKIRKTGDIIEYKVLMEGEDIGGATLRISNNKTNDICGNISYYINGMYRGHHYGSEVCSLLINEASKYHMKYIISTVNINNIASLKTMERSSFKMIQDIVIHKGNYRQYKKELEV